MLIPPKEIVQYIRYEDGDLYAENLPENLVPAFNEFKKLYESTADDLSDY